jgi:uncharacterized RDD family membrane protein YckC
MLDGFSRLTHWERHPVGEVGNFARFEKRGFAYVIDLCIIISISLIYFAQIGMMGLEVAIYVIIVGYYTTFEGVFGYTIGKRFEGLLVVHEDGSSISFKAAILRAVCLFTLDSIGWMLILFTNKRIGDYIAKTQVVNRGSGAELFS